ncbi:hypothetical protein ACJ73_02649 [Blastomyces percursus]|uniref:Uncharacterized protein n=1 Tax=Blastomyces percursus TaxID=1658174 RepID=A0A1J9QC11_9EURO|nr:hypothetical protein ACJ73_02649 [Blastomyces percursus]
MAKEKRRRPERKRAELAFLTKGCDEVAEDIAEELTLFSRSDLSLHASTTKPLKIFRYWLLWYLLDKFSVSECKLIWTFSSCVVSQRSPSCNLGP